MNKHVSQGIFESVRTREPPGYAAQKVRGWRAMPLYYPSLSPIAFSCLHLWRCISFYLFHFCIVFSFFFLFISKQLTQEHWQQCPALWHLFEHQFSVLFHYHAVYDHVWLFSTIQKLGNLKCVWKKCLMLHLSVPRSNPISWTFPDPIPLCLSLASCKISTVVSRKKKTQNF